MLRRRLGELLGGLPRQHHYEAARLILLYALGRRTSRDLQDAGRRWGCTERLFRFKSEFLDRSHYMLSVFWRACFLYFRGLGCGPRGPGATWLQRDKLLEAVRALPVSPGLAEQCVGDVGLIESFLTLDEHQALRRVGLAAHFSTPTDHDLKPLVDTLYQYCERTVRQKMRFLVNNDPGNTAEDFVAELFEAGLSVLRHYDADADQPLKLLNYARRGAKNHCLRLIDYHTAQRRARLVRQTAPPERPAACGTCAWFDCRVNGVGCVDRGALPSMPACPQDRVYTARAITTQQVCGNCTYYTVPLPGARQTCLALDREPESPPCPHFHGAVAAQEFAQTTGSLDRTLGDEPGGRRFEELVGRADSHDAQWLQGLDREVDASVMRVVRITLGHEDHDFESWVVGRTGRACHTFTDRQVARYACEFCDVPLARVKEALRTTSSLQGVG